MKTFCTSLCLFLIITASSALQKNHLAAGPEDLMDDLMADYVKLLKSTFAEKDDSKSISLLKNATPGLKSRFDKLKPELEKWISSMTHEQQEQFKQRLQTKPYIIDIFFLMNNDEVASRVENNSGLKKALSALGNTLGSAEAYKDLLK
jgi:hypothetical protein